MKFYYISLFMLLTITIWAQQPTGDIKKDTALANQYFEESLTLIDTQDTSTKALILLEQANNLYQVHPFYEKIIEIKGLWALLLDDLNQKENAGKIINETFELAKKELKTVNHPVLKYAYWAKHRVEYGADFQQSMLDGLEALKYFEKGSTSYFKVMEGVIEKAVFSNNAMIADSLINTIDQLISNHENDDLNKYLPLVYRAKMQYNMYISNFEKAVIYGEKFFNVQDSSQVFNEINPSVYVDMGQSYSGLQQFDKALEWMNKGLNAVIKKGDDNPEIGTYYANIAFVQRESGKSEKAIDSYMQAVDYLQKEEESYKENLKIIFANVSAIYYSLNNLEEAEQSIQKSRTYGADYVTDLTLGNILGLQKKYQEALEVIQLALIKVSTHFKSTNIDDNPSAYEEYTYRYASYILASKGFFLYQYGKQENDVALLKKSLIPTQLALQLDQNKVEAARGFEQSQLYNAEDVLSSLLLLSDIYHSILELTPTDEVYNDLFKVFEQKKAVQLMNTLSNSNVPSSLYQKEQQLNEAIQQNGLKLELAEMQENEDSIAFFQNKIFEVSQEMEQYLKKVKADYPNYTNSFTKEQYISIENLQSELSDDELLIEYSFNRNDTYIMTISSDNKSIQKIENAQLFENIQLIKKLLNDRFAFQKPIRDQFIDVSHELYKTLIQPVEAEIKGKKRLMFVLEGALFYLPFEALLANNDKKSYHELDFLIKKYEINYNYSATAFLKIQQKTTVQDRSLFAFAPVFNKGENINSTDRSRAFMIDSLYRSFDKGEFMALPSTKKEAKVIAKIVKSNGGKTNVLLQKNATKSNFNQQIDRQPYQFVHIATHGLVNFKKPRLSAFACYAKDDMTESLVYANEIQFKDINADLVVLSSCESGIGQLIDGQGLMALNRSFIYAGAKNVLFSLWKVSDKYSSELMIDFYKYYFENAKNASYTKALRQAKLKMLSNPASAVPKYWSAFVLMGQ